MPSHDPDGELHRSHAHRAQRSALRMPAEIFGLTLFTAGPRWRVWRVGDEPINATGSGASCRTTGTFAGGLSGINISEPGESPARAPMCLFPGRNMISDYVSKTGRWHDCARLVAAWRQRNPPQGSVMLEIGGNIGACSLEMLLRTDARLIIFEPSPMNLFHLTRSLQAAHRHSPQLGLADRLVVFPIGLGNETSATAIYADRKNSGDTIVVGKGEPSASSTAASYHKWEAQGLVTIHALDELVPPVLSGPRPTPARLAHVPLMKMDVQGYECRALTGMRRLLGSRTVDAIFTEVSLPHLKRAGCSKEGLLGLLARSGYRVDRPHGPRGFWSWDIVAVGDWHGMAGVLKYPADSRRLQHHRTVQRPEPEFRTYN